MGQARLLYIDDAGIQTMSVLYNVDGMQGVSLMNTKVVTLTNAQIKALPSTPVELIAAPGAGRVIFPIAAVFVNYMSGGAYANINANCYFAIDVGNQDLSYLVSQTVSNAVTALLGTTSRVVQLGIGGTALDDNTVFSQYANLSALTNASCTLYASNSDGDFTGGGSSNTLMVTLYYSVFNA